LVSAPDYILQTFMPLPAAPARNSIETYSNRMKFLFQFSH